MKNNFGAERFPQKTAQASESSGLQPVNEFLSNDQLLLKLLKHRKQTQAYYISKKQSTKWTCGHVECRLATLPKFFCEKSGDFLPKMREQFWEYRVLNGLNLFRSKSEKNLRI